MKNPSYVIVRKLWSRCGWEYVRFAELSAKATPGTMRLKLELSAFTDWLDSAQKMDRTTADLVAALLSKKLRGDFCVMALADARKRFG